MRDVFSFLNASLSLSLSCLLMFLLMYSYYLTSSSSCCCIRSA